MDLENELKKLLGHVEASNESDELEGPSIASLWSPTAAHREEWKARDMLRLYQELDRDEKRHQAA